MSSQLLIMGKCILRRMKQDISTTAKCFVNLFLVKMLYVTYLCVCVFFLSNLCPGARWQHRRHPCPTSLNTKYQPSRPASKRITLNLLQPVISYQRLDWGKWCLWKNIQGTLFLHLPYVLALINFQAPEDLDRFLFVFSSPKEWPLPITH